MFGVKVGSIPYGGGRFSMNSAICNMFGIEFPLLAFSHCRNVVVEVSKAGGMGVLGAVDISSPEQLEVELRWIDQHIGGKPYGVDFIVPAKFESKSARVSTASAGASVPAKYKDLP